jgi:hypothetical protein
MDWSVAGSNTREVAPSQAEVFTCPEPSQPQEKVGQTSPGPQRTLSVGGSCMPVDVEIRIHSSDVAIEEWGRGCRVVTKPGTESLSEESDGSVISRATRGKLHYI